MCLELQSLQDVRKALLQCLRLSPATYNVFLDRTRDSCDGVRKTVYDAYRFQAPLTSLRFAATKTGASNGLDMPMCQYIPCCQTSDESNKLALCILG